MTSWSCRAVLPAPSSPLPLALKRLKGAWHGFMGLVVALTLVLMPPTVASAEIRGSLVIAGNGPELTTIETLARAFERANPRAYIDILWDEDSTPVDLVKTGQAQLAVTGADDPAMRATQIGWDGIGILVHLSNYTKDVTKQQVADVFSGKVRDWSELGGPDSKILPIDRPRNQNIRDAFKTHLGIAGKPTGQAKTIGDDEQVVKTVVGTLPPLSAVAYISLSTGLSAVSSGVAVRLLPVDKVEPEIPTVKDGRYQLRRPVLLLSKKEPSPLAEAFAAFARSAPGQAIVGEIYVPLSTQ
jgi:phosphate transport system substrate-binding protein